jgi:hypothetical protein
MMDHPNLQAGVFVGIDWGGQHHHLCVLDTDGTRRLEARIDHDVAGLAYLDKTLASFGDGLPIAIERAEGLLVERLQATGHVVFPVSPRIAARARERYRVASVKDDVFDAAPRARPLAAAAGAVRSARGAECADP